MFNLSTIGLLHRHGNEWSPMDPLEEDGDESVEHSSPESHDVERKILSGRRIYRCRACSEQIAVDDGSPT